MVYRHLQYHGALYTVLLNHSTRVFFQKLTEVDIAHSVLFESHDIKKKKKT